MARSDTKSAGAKKAGRIKLPKRIAGMKVPRALRKSGAKATEWVTSSTGREILAAALVAAAAALASRKVREAVSEGAKDAASGAGRMGQAVADAAADVMRRPSGGDQGEASSTKRQATKRGRSRPGQPTFTH